MRIHPGLFAAVLVVFSMPAGAQWLKYKTPGIPRTTDGKPDLNAPAPRTVDGKPDLSGLWRGNAGGYAADIATDLKPGWIRMMTLAGCLDYRRSEERRGG